MAAMAAGAIFAGYWWVFLILAIVICIFLFSSGAMDYITNPFKFITFGIGGFTGELKGGFGLGKLW